MKKTITDNEKCINCGLCEYYCQHKAITFEENKEGFEYPCINDNCVDCGLCTQKCIMNQHLKQDIREYTDVHAYIGRYLAREEVKKSTSGGFCNAISEWVIKQGGVVFGVTYSDDFQNICYKSAEKREQLTEFRSVKYAQSKHLDIRLLEEALETKNMVLVIGLPCMITAIKDWAGNRYDNLLTVALICHGPTSVLVHRKFLEEYALDKNVTFLNLRKKKAKKSMGWLVMKTDGNDKLIKPWSTTVYASAFNILLRKSCYSCEFKLGSLKADFLVGDYWGRGTNKLKNSQGMSAIIILDKKRNKILNELNDYCVDYIPLTTLLEDNPALITSAKENINRGKFVSDLQKMSLSEAVYNVEPRKKRIYSIIRAYALFLLPNDIQYMLQKWIRIVRR